MATGFILESPFAKKVAVSRSPGPELFPPRTWRPHRELAGGMYMAVSDQGDAVLTSYKLHGDNVNCRGTTVMVSPFATGFWIRARLYETAPAPAPAVVVDWNVRNRTDTEVEMRTTGHNDGLADAVGSVVARGYDAYRAVDEICPGYADFAAGARRALADEIAAKTLPSRLRKYLV